MLEFYPMPTNLSRGAGFYSHHHQNHGGTRTFGNAPNSVGTAITATVLNNSSNCGQQQQQQHQISNDISSSANSEVLKSGNFVTDMPEILSVAALNTNHHKNNNNISSSVAGSNTKTATMHNVRLPSISPTLSLNGSSNDANNGEFTNYLVS